MLKLKEVEATMGLMYKPSRDTEKQFEKAGRQLYGKRLSSIDRFSSLKCIKLVKFKVKWRKYLLKLFIRVN